MRSKSESKQDILVDCQLFYCRQINATVPEQIAVQFGQPLIIKCLLQCQA